MKILEKVVEAGTAYGAGILLFLQDINYAVLGGLILFAARAADGRDFVGLGGAG